MEIVIHYFKKRGILLDHTRWMVIKENNFSWAISEATAADDNPLDALDIVLEHLQCQMKMIIIDCKYLCFEIVFEEIVTWN